ncbi:MAG: hypothetical protein AAGI01_02080 [Myxococcota bacterium]
MSSESIILGAALAVMLTCALPAQAEAQQPEEATPSPFSGAFDDATRRTFYEDQKLEVAPLVLSNLLIPGLGNVRTEQYLLGAALMGVSVIGVMTMAGGVLLREETDTGLVLIGASALVLSLGTSVVTTNIGVRAYNKRLRERYKVDLAQGAPVGLTVTWQF